MNELFNATGVAIKGLRPVLFSERAWRQTDNSSIEPVDLDRLKRWLNGDKKVRPDAPGAEFQAHLISSEQYRTSGNIANFRDVLAVYERERPDIVRMVYDGELRFVPQWPGQVDRMQAEIKRRQADPIEAEILARSSVVAVDAYWFGTPAMVPCPTCTTGKVQSTNEVDVEASKAFMLQYIPGMAKVLVATGRPLAATVHHRFIPGLGKFNAFPLIPEELWRLYLQTVLGAFERAVWWSGPESDQVGFAARAAAAASMEITVAA